MKVCFYKGQVTYLKLKAEAARQQNSYSLKKTSHNSMEGYCNFIMYEILYLFSVSEVWFVHEVCVNCLGAKPTINQRL